MVFGLQYHESIFLLGWNVRRQFIINPLYKNKKKITYVLSLKSQDVECFVSDTKHDQAEHFKVLFIQT